MNPGKCIPPVVHDHKATVETFAVICRFCALDGIKPRHGAWASYAVALNRVPVSKLSTHDVLAQELEFEVDTVFELPLLKRTAVTKAVFVQFMQIIG